MGPATASNVQHQAHCCVWQRQCSCLNGLLEPRSGCAVHLLRELACKLSVIGLAIFFFLHVEVSSSVQGGNICYDQLGLHVTDKVPSYLPAERPKWRLCRHMRIPETRYAFV